MSFRRNGTEIERAAARFVVVLPAVRRPNSKILIIIKQRKEKKEEKVKIASTRFRPVLKLSRALPKCGETKETPQSPRYRNEGTGALASSPRDGVNDREREKGKMLTRPDGE